MREMVSVRSMNIRKGERVFLAIGLALLATWAGVRIYGSMASHAAIARFQASQSTASSIEPGVHAKDGSLSPSAVDFKDWNPKRVAAYKESLSTKTDLPLAILRIPKIGLEVPVFNDTDISL